MGLVIGFWLLAKSPQLKANRQPPFLSSQNQSRKGRQRDFSILLEGLAFGIHTVAIGIHFPLALREREALGNAVAVEGHESLLPGVG